MKKLHWILPSIIISIGVSILIFNNFKEVTAAPSDSWNREVELATTPIQSDISTTRDSNGNYNIFYFTDNGLIQREYNNAFERVNQETYDIPYTKWTEVYPGEENIIYADNSAMYRAVNNEKISDVQEFIPLKNGVVYQNKENVYHLNGHSLEKSLLAEGVDEETLVDVYHSEGRNTYLLLSDIKRNVTEYRLLKWDEKSVTEVDEQAIELEPAYTLNELSFTVDNGQLSLFVQAGPFDKYTYIPEEKYYFTQQKLGLSISLTSVQFSDPYSQKDLQDLQDFDLNINKGMNELLFRAEGSTETKYREAMEYNVFKGTLNDAGEVDLTRLSNTPWLSKNPALVDDDIVVWLDAMGDTNKIFAAGSTDLEQFPEPSLSTDTWLRIVGKTIAMLSGSLLMLLVTMGWYVVPVGFIGIMTFGSNNALDKGKEWVFYTPVLLYLIAALYFNEQLFSENMMTLLPEYLNFQGSPFFLICAFGVITYLIMVLSGLREKWSISARVFYFVAVHISFLMIFVGPFTL